MVKSTPKELPAEGMAFQDAAASLDQSATMAQDEKKRLAAPPADEQVMLEQKKKEKSALVQALKAAKAAKLTQKDAVPSAVVTLNNGSLKLATIHSDEAFIYQGSVGCAHNQQELVQAGITHILTCAAGIEQKFPKDFKYETLDLLDTGEQNIGMYFQQARGFINQCKEEGGRVLIHCFAGKSRASTITLSYLMKEMKLDLKTSLDHLKKQRPIAEPNVGFLIQLRHYEKQIFGTNSDVPITDEQIEKEKHYRKCRTDLNIKDEAEFIKGLKTIQELMTEGAVKDSDQKQLSDANEIIKKVEKLDDIVIDLNQPQPTNHLKSPSSKDIKRYLVLFLQYIDKAKGNEEKIKDLVEKLFKYVKKEIADKVIRQKIENTLVLMLMQCLRNRFVVVRDMTIKYKLELKFATKFAISKTLNDPSKEKFDSQFDIQEFTDLVLKFVKPQGQMQKLTETWQKASEDEKYHKNVDQELKWKPRVRAAIDAERKGDALDMAIVAALEELSDEEFKEFMENEEVKDYFNDPDPVVLQPDDRADVKNELINWKAEFKHGFIVLLYS